MKCADCSKAISRGATERRWNDKSKTSTRIWLCFDCFKISDAALTIKFKNEIRNDLRKKSII